jgi:hypothetical protein
VVLVVAHCHYGGVGVLAVSLSLSGAGAVVVHETRIKKREGVCT